MSIAWSKFYKKRPVLVTGGAGFIGSHLVEALVEAEAIVTILDNFSTGSIETLNKTQHKISIIVGDITNPKTCAIATKNKTHVFHLAAAISVAESIKNPQKYALNNVEGTRLLLDAAKKNCVNRVVFSSSAAIYGNYQHPCHELLTPTPASPYAESKRLGEEICTEFNKSKTIECIALRYFNVYGDRQKTSSGYGAVIPTFMAKLKQNEPLTIFGNGLQTRDFVSVHEVVEANLMAGCTPMPELPIFNVATGSSKTLLALIDELVIKLNCPQPQIQFIEARPGDIQHSQADCRNYNLLKKTVGTLYESS